MSANWSKLVELIEATEPFQTDRLTLADRAQIDQSIADITREMAEAGLDALDDEIRFAFLLGMASAIQHAERPDMMGGLLLIAREWIPDEHRRTS